MTRQPIPKVSNIENPCILHRIYSDICGPMQNTTQDGHRYFMTFIDSHSWYIKVKLLKTKDEVVEKLMALIEHAEVKIGEQVNYFWSNGGSEYFSRQFAKYLKSKEIHHELTNSDTLQENGVTERANHTLVHTARMMLFKSSLPRSFWGYAILYTTHILNRVINRGASTKKTPYHLYTGSRPSVTHLRSFGCGAQVLLTGVKDKLALCLVRGVFIGLSENKKAYIIYDGSTEKTHISHDVVFYESGQVRPSEVHITISNSEESDEEIDITVNARPDLKASQNYRSKVLAENLPDTTLEDSSTELAVKGSRAPVFNTPISVAVLNPPPPEVHRSARLKCQPICDNDDHYQKSSYKHGEFSWKSRTTTSGTIERGTEEIVKVTRTVGNESAKVANIDPDPLTYAEAMSRSDGAQWRAACAEEMEQFVHQNIFDMVPKPEGHKVVDCKWVFKTKLGPDGQVKHYKARLVAKEFSQVESIDFNETYSSVIGHSTVRTLLALACANS